MATELAEAARDGDALAALVFSGRVLGGGDGGRRGLFQLLTVRRRAAREHGVDLGHVFGQSLIDAAFCAWWQREALWFVSVLNALEMLSSLQE